MSNDRRQRRLPLAILLALLASPLPFLAAPAAAGQGPVVVQIDVRDFDGDPQAIRDIIQTKEGAPLDRAALDEDISRLYQAGYLASFRIETVPTGVRLIIDITPNPRIRTVAVKGAGGSWNGKLKEEITTRAGTPVSAAILKLPEEQRFVPDKERIRTWCQEHGYRDVAVTSQTAPVPGTDQVDVAFQVALGAKFQVKWLRFEGNQAIGDRELRGRMRTKRDGLFTSRRYHAPYFDEDIARLQDFCRFKGFPNAKVTYRRAFRGPQGNQVDLTIAVEEGRQFPTAAVAVQGNQIVATETILRTIALKTGEVFSDEKLIASAETIERLYQEAGYPDIRVAPTRQLTAPGDAYDATFAVEEGQRIVIHMVRTRGNAQTQQDVILRELELQPGMVYDIRKLKRSQRALERLGFFETVKLDLAPADPPVAGERDLLVSVEEGRTGAVRFGLGFSTTDAIVGAVDLTQRNFDWRRRPKNWGDLLSGNAFVGAGQFFRIALMPGTVLSTYLIQYENPYWKHHEDGRNESFGWSLYWRDRWHDEWAEGRVGLRLSRGLRKYKGDPDTDLVFHSRIEAARVFRVDKDDAPKDAVDDEGTHPLLGLGATLIRDRTDRVFLPTSGVRWDAGPEVVVPHGIKFGLGGARYWSLGDRPKGHERVVSLRGRLDYGLGSFPIYERYYAGAPLIRGFDYRGVGPRDNDEPEGGKYRAILSTQYRVPLVPNILYSVLFCDTGTVTKDFSVFGSPRASVGLGFRVLIPRLSRAPLTLDLGIPIVKTSGDDTQVVYFSLALPWGGIGLGRRSLEREEEPITPTEE